MIECVAIRVVSFNFGIPQSMLESAKQWNKRHIFTFRDVLNGLGVAGNDFVFCSEVGDVRKGFQATESAVAVVREGLHAVDSDAAVVRGALIPGHLREGDRVSRFIKRRCGPWGSVRTCRRNSSAMLSTG